MARVPFADRNNMDSEGQAIWDEIDQSRGGVARNLSLIHISETTRQAEIS